MSVASADTPSASGTLQLPSMLQPRAASPSHATGECATYDRERLADFIASTNQTSHATAAGGNKNTLFASALTQLATELAKVHNVAWEKVSQCTNTHASD